ncbi:MAG: protein phosphatase 2C domain-containing protein [Gammaproteobacteria bacterium]|nr:protein phosphatase 2C domain-containing protein [Gammaproteobacteria bacterium]MBU1414619.1 protein phosphatase 2C domain-containing protein [Gammaproteobacteria bacterium]
MPLTIQACTAQHIGDRQEQQDRVAIFPHPKTKGALLAAVADGMGGHTGGALAAEQVLHSANSSFSAIGLGPQYVRDMLESGINDAHDAIRLTRYTSEQDPHSTACLLILQPGQVDWAHCGDSRIYHFRDGKLIKRSVDHSYVMDLVQRGFMTEEQAEEHPNKNILISCLGDRDAPRIEYGKAQPLVAGDCFLLCTDGLWAYFSDIELGRVLREKPPRQAAEWLIDAARSRAEGRGDNCSLAIVRLKEVDKPPPLGRR